MDASKQNFLSVDGKTAISSYKEYFKIGEIVEHDGADCKAEIESFEISKTMNEIRVNTSRGFCHIDFLIKLD